MPRTRKKRIQTGFEEISPDDIVALGDFLDHEPLGKRSMGIAMLDGFLTAMIIGPELVMPSDYLPWIWDWKRGKKDAGFKDLDEANRILGYLQGMHNRVAGAMMSDPPVLVPLFVFEPAWDHIEWMQGFLMGAEFDDEVWEYAREEIPEDFESFKTLASMERDAPGWEDACHALSLSFIHIRDYFREGSWREAFQEVQQPVVRQGPKIGRNDPCPCGSGRKFKNCCGDASAPVH